MQVGGVCVQVGGVCVQVGGVCVLVGGVCVQVGGVQAGLRLSTGPTCRSLQSLQMHYSVADVAPTKFLAAHKEASSGGVWCCVALCSVLCCSLVLCGVLWPGGVGVEACFKHLLPPLTPLTIPHHHREREQPCES